MVGMALLQLVLVTTSTSSMSWLAQTQNVHGMQQIIPTMPGFAKLGKAKALTQDCPTENREKSQCQRAK
jgi:hypothetical protein